MNSTSYFFISSAIEIVIGCMFFVFYPKIKTFLCNIDFLSNRIMDLDIWVGFIGGIIIADFIIFGLMDFFISLAYLISCR